jgi:hypothetical protein
LQDVVFVLTSWDPSDNFPLWSELH